jgi:hypothetical protein
VTAFCPLLALEKLKWDGDLRITTRQDDIATSIQVMRFRCVYCPADLRSEGIDFATMNSFNSRTNEKKCRFSRGSSHKRKKRIYFRHPKKKF